jgi:5'-nucleotidase
MTMQIARSVLAFALGTCLFLGGAALADDWYDHDQSPDNAQLRSLAAKEVHWIDPALPANANPASWTRVKLLGFNDFHGALQRPNPIGGRPVGGAAGLASYLRAAQAQAKDGAIIVHAGDFVGASPLASALLQDEPSISFLNMLANEECTYDNKFDLDCDVVGTLGNHEFDEGKTELLRLLNGGNHASGPFLENPWKGARVPYVSANVVETNTGRHLLRPYVIKRIEAARIGFIGAVLKETPTIVTPSGVAGLSFLDEATEINAQVSALKAQNVHAIVVTIHQGQPQTSYTGPTNPNLPEPPPGPIVDIVKNLDDDVDIVVSGHSHTFMNVLIVNKNGKEILVTQGFSNGTAYDDIDIAIDPATKDVVEKSARIVTTWADEGPGLTPVAEVASLVSQAVTTVAPIANQVIGTASAAITRTESTAGESALGNLIADAQRAAMGTQVALMNPGGIRADIPGPGTVTYNALFTVQPFGNSLVKMNLTGQQIVAVLEQQWAGQPFTRILKPSGITCTWDAAQPVGSRVVAGSVHIGGATLVPAQIYSVTVNSFLAAGGDNFTVLVQGTNKIGGPIDLDALVDYITDLPQPFSAAIEGRIQRLN